MNYNSTAISVCIVISQLTSVGASDILETNDLPESILAKLAQVEGEVAKCNFSVSCRYTSRLAFKPSAQPRSSDTVALKTAAQTEWIIGVGDSRCYTYQGRTTSVLSDGSTFHTARNEKSVFDALTSEARTITKTCSTDGVIDINDRTSSVFGGGACPLRMTGYVAGTRASDLLVGSQVKVVDQLKLDGRPVVLLQTAPKQIEGMSASYYTQIWVDTERWLMVKRKLFGRDAAHLPFRPTMQIKCEQFVLVSERLWLPTNIHVWRWDPVSEVDVRKGRESHFTYEDWKIEPELSEQQFALEFTVDDPTSDK